MQATLRGLGVSLVPFAAGQSVATVSLAHYSAVSVAAAVVAVDYAGDGVDVDVDAAAEEHLLSSEPEQQVHSDRLRGPGPPAVDYLVRSRHFASD